MEAGESTADSFALLARAVHALGFGAVGYVVIPLSLSVDEHLAPSFLISDNVDPGFRMHYEQARVADRDFTTERARAGDLAVVDWREERRRDRLGATQREFVDVALVDFGIRSALTIPTRGDRHVVAGVSVFCEEREDRFAKVKEERLGTLQTIARVFHRRVFEVPVARRHFYSRFLDQLSEDEAKVIRLVIGGHRLKSSLDHCGISPTRAGNLLSSLYRKLRISNASELAYLVGVHQVDRFL